MDMMAGLMVLGGLVLLTLGGDALVRGAVAVARHFHVSPLLIGLTLVGFGTSTPELVTSIDAALSGSPGIAVGNVVGSNICNILLILGTAALLYPLRASLAAVRRDGSMMLLAALAAVAAALVGYINFWLGAAFLAVLAAYIIFTYRHERRHKDASAHMHAAEGHAVHPAPHKLWLSIVMTIGGLGLTIAGAHFLVEGAVTLARVAGISETIIGLTIVAVGTSLPELVTSVMAAIRRENDVALGNVLGSNIYNILGILGVTALITPVQIPAEIIRADIWIMLAVTILLIAVIAWRQRLGRAEGAAFLACYGGYIAWLGTQV
jgi:cation:H+ antiporter